MTISKFMVINYLLIENNALTIHKIEIYEAYSNVALVRKYNGKPMHL